MTVRTFGFVFYGMIPETTLLGYNTGNMTEVYRAVKKKTDLPEYVAGDRALEEVRLLEPGAIWKDVYLHQDITDNPIWGNCLYGGYSMGHSPGFCTARSCY